jgi:hypothetical protein
MNDQAIRTSDEEREREEEALAALAGLSLWRARNAVPVPTTSDRPPNLLTRLPPYAWSLLFL